MHDTTAKAIGEHITAALDGSVTLPSAETCREYATSRYDWSVIAQQVRDVYEEVL
jgi:glycosyltransferase involved in cell wall biosynthesis